jgi:hypothetical protein
MRCHYRVWCPDRGTTKDDGRRILAYDPESAAIKWAVWDDETSADYAIVGGTSVEVVVAEDLDGAPEHQFTVYGQPCYRACATGVKTL